jgi:Fe-S cluster biogenesis protein NfuA
MQTDPAEQLIGRVQALQADLGGIADPRARQLSEELLGAVIELYGEGMRRIVGALEEEGATGADVRTKLAEDGVVASLLLIHDLYPVPISDRVQQGLDEVRPYLDSHGGGVQLLGIEDGVARIKLEGSCKTCPASSATLELAVKQALDDAAPDLEGLIVEGIQDSEPAPDPTGLELPVMQVKTNGAEPEPSKAAAAQAALSAEAAGVAGWRRLDEAETVEEGRVRSLSLAGTQLAVARVDGTLLAFRDACAGCGAEISAGTLLGGALSCPSCELRYDLPRAGRTADGGAQLEPVPLLAEAAGVRVALAT